MPGEEGRDRFGEPLGRPTLAERREDRDRGGEDRGLGVLGQVEPFGRAAPGEIADGLPERLIGRREDGSGGGRILGDRSAHADGLGTLAGTHEGEVTHHAERRRWSRP